MADRQYLCIDLKSFYASVECVERGLDSMTTNLVVADMERTDKTICLAVSPSMKKLGVKNRCRVFEIPTNIDYIAAPPRMQKYIEYSAKIYSIYLKYISDDDIHVYSIDEAFLDVTHYLSTYRMNAEELAKTIMADIFDTTGIRATCGIGTNLYLAKIALDITAKHSPDFIGILDEEKFKETLWDHRPITDFWRIGKGTAARLDRCGIHTMGDIACASEDMLYRTFGIDAELLIDHAYGRETTTIEDIKKYVSRTKSLSSGQVLTRDYKFDEAKIVVTEMMDNLCLSMCRQDLVTSSVTLVIGYSNALHLEMTRGTFKVNSPTNSSSVLSREIQKLYTKIVNPAFPVRRINISCNNVVTENFVQLDLFDIAENADRDKKIQKTMLEIKSKFGKNSILRGTNFLDGATARERNRQIGGHKSGE